MYLLFHVACPPAHHTRESISCLGIFFSQHSRQKRHIAGVFIAQSATELIVFNNAPTIYTRSVMGLKKRSLSRSGAASHVIIATNDGSS
jgi:hypothetical protein